MPDFTNFTMTLDGFVFRILKYISSESAVDTCYWPMFTLEPKRLLIYNNCQHLLPDEQLLHSVRLNFSGDNISELHIWTSFYVSMWVCVCVALMLLKNRKCGFSRSKLRWFSLIRFPKGKKNIYSGKWAIGNLVTWPSPMVRISFLM